LSLFVLIFLAARKWRKYNIRPLIAINNPHLNILQRNLKRLCNAPVLELSAAGASCKTRHGQKSHLAMKFAVVQTLFLDESVVLVSKVIIIL